MNRWFRVWAMGWLALALLTACASASDRAPTATPKPVASPAPTDVEQTLAPATATASRVAPSLATLRAQLTADPCTKQDVTEFAQAVLPLADEHIVDSAEARRLSQISDEEFIDGMYDRGKERRARMGAIVPPPCAEKSHLKFTSAMRLLVDVWDHIGEGEFNLARRKLLSSYDELARGASLLSELETELAGR